MNNEKNRVYEKYVSSGQAGNVSIDGGRLVEVKKVIDEHVPKDKSCRVIDIGCGYGIYLKELKERGYEKIKGVDVSSEQVEAAKKNGLKNIQRKQALSFLEEEKDESVDVVLMIDIIEHMNKEKTFSVMDEVCRVLRKGGKCIIHVPNAQGIFGMRVRYGDLTHERAFSPKSIRQLLRTTGFTNVSVFEDKPVVHGIPSLGRRMLWEVMTPVLKLLLLVESPGAESLAMSQNLLVTAFKNGE
ncbi:class I SAM-dependent methyltransferase [Salinibacter grassmerensis]|uniref:class I SAM-dependent methyltransferase n=1 Tax=Salinibacter grassmerensis TaxID=3040353 RepID=UPI0021E8DE99|nr:class I SAM-dependent methyltransferase [Salinibacter grassmerensis]